jgi:PAS domain S-box-containing protein
MNSIQIAPSQDSLFQSIQLLNAYEKAINANVISTITDRQGMIIYANEKFCEVSKFELSAILGQNHRIINSGHHPREFFHELWATISSGQVWHGEVKNKASDGTFYWVDTVIVPIKDANDRNTHYLSLRMLITDRKNLEEKRYQYVTSLEILLVMTSSKIKKPLSECVIQMNELKSDKPISKDDLNDVLDKLSQTVKQLDTFTNELNVFIREMVK